MDNLGFDDVAASVLNEKSMWKSKEDRQVSSQQAHALLVTKGDQWNMAPMGVTIMVDQNLEVRRILNATTMVRNGTSKKNVRTTRKEERAKNLSHQMLSGV